MRIAADHLQEAGRTAGRPTRAQAPNIRRKILSAAMGEFSERGFHGGSIAGIAERAVVSRRTIYNHFQTKEQILEVLVEDTSSRLRRRLEEIIEEGGEVWEVLFKIGMCFQEKELVLDGRAISRVLVLEAQQTPEVGQMGLVARQSILEPIANYMERQSFQGILAIDDIGRAAQQFLHLTTSSVDYLFGDDEHSPEEKKQWVAAAVKTFLYGVAVQR